MRNNSKQERQQAIARLIGSGAIGSQEELADRLGGLGFSATQATISRDLDQLGAARTRSGGRIRYALPDRAAAAAPAQPRLGRLVRDWVRAIDPAGNLLVLKTPPGSAHLVGVALDEAALDEIVGTICGDDTIFAACRTPAAAGAAARRLRSLAHSAKAG